MSCFLYLFEYFMVFKGLVLKYQHLRRVLHVYEGSIMEELWSNLKYECQIAVLKFSLKSAIFGIIVNFKFIG